MEVIVTNERTGRKYKITPASNGLGFMLYQTSNVAKGEKSKNGHVVKNEWQFTGKYPSDVTHGLELVFNLMQAEEDGNVVDVTAEKAQRAINKELRDMIRDMAKSIEVKEVEECRE